MTYDYILLDANSGIPVYQQLYLAIKNAIEAGHLAKGDKLPSIRKLSGDLSLSCTTVESAYQQLCVEGYLDARPQRGYFVLAEFRKGFEGKKQPQINAVPRNETKIRYDFGTDSVDSANIDLKIWRRHIRDALNRQEVLASYGDPQGEPELRKALASYSYGVRGVVAAPEQIVIGAGTQPLLSILCGLLSGPKRTVAMEEPGFLQAEQVFTDCSIKVVHLPADQSGVCMDALRDSGSKIVFVSPSNHVHTGAGMPMNRRVEILDWAREAEGLIIEDDYNGELRYSARPIPAMQGMDENGNVVYLGSFSKLLLPSVRIAYMVLPPRLAEQYLPRAKRYNQTASKIEQLALSHYVKEGQLERQLRRLRKLYALKSSMLIHALKREFGSTAIPVLQETLLCLTVTLKTEAQSEHICALAAQNGVRVMPVKNDGSCKILLGFAGIPVQDIEAAVHSLKQALASVIHFHGNS